VLGCNQTAGEGMFEECVGVIVVAGSVRDQSSNEQVLAVRKVAGVAASQKDQAIGECIAPGLGERLVGRRSSLENEARIRTIRGTEGRMTGPCEDWVV
jgi:coenzyme F420-reducing hydrogenase gamma subunit